MVWSQFERGKREIKKHSCIKVNWVIPFSIMRPPEFNLFCFLLGRNNVYDLTTADSRCSECTLKFSLCTCQQQVTLHVWAEVGIPWPVLINSCIRWHGYERSTHITPTNSLKDTRLPKIYLEDTMAQISQVIVTFFLSTVRLHSKVHNFCFLLQNLYEINFLYKR